MKLTSRNVEDLFQECLYDNESTSISDAKIVEGVLGKFGFNPENLKKNEEKILELLNQCHSNFKTSSGSEGWSFLEFARDKNDQVWTSEHRICDLLICMGIGIDKVKFSLPRKFWKSLPGGVPYIQIHL